VDRLGVALQALGSAQDTWSIMRGQQLTNPPDYLWRDKWTALKWTTLSSCPAALGGSPGLTGIEAKVQG